MDWYVKTTHTPPGLNSVGSPASVLANVVSSAFTTTLGRGVLEERVECNAHVRHTQLGCRFARDFAHLSDWNILDSVLVSPSLGLVLCHEGTTDATAAVRSAVLL